MSSFKFAIICAVLVFSSQVGASRLHIENSPGDDYIDYQLIAQTFGGALKVASFAVDKVLSGADMAITKFSKDLPDIQTKTVDVSTKVLDGLRNLIARQLAFAESHGANDDAKVVSACIQADGSIIVKDIVSFWDVTTKCFNPSLQAAADSLSPVIQKTDSTFVDLGKIGDQLISNCEDLDCITSASLQIVQLFATFKEDVGPQWSEFLSAGSKYVSSFLQCNVDEIGAWKKGAIAELSNISTCFRK